MDLATISDQAWQVGRLSMAARLRRLESKVWLIGQCAISAAVAWWIATELLGHTAAFFAPAAAVIALGTSYGQRQRRVAEVAIGCTVGIGIADIFAKIFGQGGWQIAVVVAGAMSVGVLLGAGALLVTQAAVQSIVVTILVPTDAGLSRIVDALIGGVVALIAATVVPGAPLRRPREEAATVTRELSRLLREARTSSQDIDVEAASDTLDRARETATLLEELRAAAREGIDVVRSSPFRRSSAPHVRKVADLVEPLDRAFRNTRVLIRRIVVAARVGETMPPDYLVLLDELAVATDEIADRLAANQSPETAQSRLIGIAAATADASPALTLSAAVVLGQIRSLDVDLLELSGVPSAEAYALVPPRS